MFLYVFMFNNLVYGLYNVQFTDIRYYFYIGFTIAVFGTGLCGIVTNRRNLVMVLLYLELLLLSVNFNLILFSVLLDIIIGQVVALFVLVIAGSEVSIGLAFLILAFRTKGVLLLHFFRTIKS